MNYRISPVLILSAILHVAVIAQTKPVPTVPVSSSCNNEAAIETIQQQLAETKTFDDQSGRITAVLRAADLLWPYQQDKSRAAFAEAFDLALQHFKDNGDEPKLEGVGMAITVPDMRYTVISAISKRDSAWARKLTEKLLIDQMAEAKEKSGQDAVQESRTAEKLLSLASNLLQSDQTAALNFAVQSLRFPATMYLGMFLYELAAVDRASADQFYQNALAAYAKAPMNRFLYLSAYPFGRDRDAGVMPSNTVYDVPEGFAPSPTLQRLFVQLLLGRIQEENARPSDAAPGSRLTESEQMLLALRRLENQVQQTLPDLAPAVEQAKSDLGGKLSEGSLRKLGQLTTAPKRSRATFAEQIEAAEKNPNVDQRDQGIVFAVTSASASEDLETILSAANKISNSTTRGQLLNWFYFSRTLEAIKQKEFTRARSLAAKVDELDQRGFLYFRIADESMKQSLDQSQAREMLEEVVEAAAKAPATMVSARTQLGIAHLYTKIDVTRAIAVLADAVKTINRMEAPDFSRQFVMRRIEGKTFGTYAAFLTPGYNPENAFKEIAKSDFDGTLFQATNFANKTLRALTTLAVIEPCLKISKDAAPGKKPKVMRP